MSATRDSTAQPPPDAPRPVDETASLTTNVAKTSTDEAGAPAKTLTSADFRAVQESEDFALLRRTFRSFAFPMTVAFLVWYFAYVLLSSYAHGLMSIPVYGNLNLGLTWGLLQFLSTFVITALYVRHANRRLDPLAKKIRTELEQVTQ